MIILIILIIVLLLSLSYINNLFKKDREILEEVKLKENSHDNGFALMLQKDDGTYEESTSNSWPTNMIFNSELSGCIDTYGNKIDDSLSFDPNTNLVTISTNKTSYCYLYFDIVNPYPSVTLTVSTDGIASTLPTYNHYKQTLTCDTGTTSTFNTKYQRIEISNVSKTNTRCTLNYANDTSTYTLLKTKVEQVNTTNNNGYRYSGKEPNNWVWFNNELWRIIGSIPTKLSDGTIVNKVKIIRSESIGGLVYHSSGSNTTWGSNTLYTLLNTKYYGKLNATGTNLCLGYSNDGYALCNYTNKGISSVSTDYYGRMVENVYWNTGATSGSSTVTSAYTNEAATQTVSGKIGLMSASDYGYATSGINYSNVNLSSLESYEQNNWLYGQGWEWIISQLNAYYVLVINSSGGINYSEEMNYNSSVRPVVYLNSNVYIISGSGTESDPYILGM